MGDPFDQVIDPLDQFICSYMKKNLLKHRFLTGGPWTPKVRGEGPGGQ